MRYLGIINICLSRWSHRPLNHQLNYSPGLDFTSHTDRNGLDLSHLDPALQIYLKQGLAHRTYEAGVKHFYEFCVLVNLLYPFSLTEKSLCYFTSFLATWDLSAQTIKVYVAAVRDLHINMGFPDPRDHSSLPLLKRVQAGIQRVQALKGKGKARGRLPITPHLLR